MSIHFPSKFLLREIESAGRPYYEAGQVAVLLKEAAAPETVHALSGELQLSNGFLVLRISSKLCEGAFDSLHEVGTELPKTPSGIIDSKIVVFTDKEVEKINSDKISERGHKVEFKINGIKCCEQPFEGCSKYWFFDISSPKLSAIRRSYGLTESTPNDAGFRLIFAIRKTKVLHTNEIRKYGESLQEVSEDTSDNMLRERAALQGQVSGNMPILQKCAETTTCQHKTDEATGNRSISDSEMSKRSKQMAGILCLEPYESQMSKYSGQRMAQLWRTRYLSMPEMGYLYEFLQRHGSTTIKKAFIGSDRREWKLRTDKLSMGHTSTTSKEQTKLGTTNFSRTNKVDLRLGGDCRNTSGCFEIENKGKLANRKNTHHTIYTTKSSIPTINFQWSDKVDKSLVKDSRFKPGHDSIQISSELAYRQDFISTSEKRAKSLEIKKPQHFCIMRSMLAISGNMDNDHIEKFMPELGEKLKKILEKFKQEENTKESAELPYRQRVDAYAVKGNKVLSGISKKYPGTPFFWGGGIEAGETPEQAAARELHEETGYQLNNPSVSSVKPLQLDWSPAAPGMSEKALEKRKQWKGDITHFVTGDLGNYIGIPPGADVSTIKNPRLRSIQSLITKLKRPGIQDPFAPKQLEVLTEILNKRQPGNKHAFAQNKNSAEEWAVPNRFSRLLKEAGYYETSFLGYGFDDKKYKALGRVANVSAAFREQVRQHAEKLIGPGGSVVAGGSQNFFNDIEDEFKHNKALKGVQFSDKQHRLIENKQRRLLGLLKPTPMPEGYGVFGMVTDKDRRTANKDPNTMWRPFRAFSLLTPANKPFVEYHRNHGIDPMEIDPKSLYPLKQLDK